MEKLISNSEKKDSCKPLFRKNNILTLPCIYIYETIKYVHNNRNTFDNVQQNHNYKTRNSNELLYPIHRLSLYEKTPYYMGITLGNKTKKILQKHGNNIRNPLEFFRKLLIKKCYYSIEEFLEDNLLDLSL